MKNFLALLFLGSFPSLFFAQSVFPEPKDSALWNIGFWRFYENINDFSVVPAKDTMLCEQRWIKVNFINSSIAHTYYQIDGRKVYLRANTDCNQAAHLIYDFDLKVGDTLYVPTNLAETQGYLGSRGVRVMVDSISRVLIKGVLRKQLAVTYRYKGLGLSQEITEDRNDVWIEGMGSRIFPFYALLCVTHGNCEDSNSFIRCFQRNKQIFYQDIRSPFCNPLLSTTIREPVQHFPIKLYPNPFSSGETLQIDGSALVYKPVAYQIVDLLGRVKASGKLEAWHSNLISINLDQLPTGFYQLQLMDREGRQVALERVVKN